MKGKEQTPWGAPVERGRIRAAEGDGYIIESYDRAGIITPPLKAMNGSDTFSAGEKVYYILFADGTGAILGRL